jgi:hypothetical protein
VVPCSGLNPILSLREKSMSIKTRIRPQVNDGWIEGPIPPPTRQYSKEEIDDLIVQAKVRRIKRQQISPKILAMLDEKRRREANFQKKKKRR